MGSVGDTDSKCWVTLVTRPSYLPGVIILAHSLDLQDSQYPMVVQYTSTLGQEAIAALEAEAKSHGRIIPSPVELLLPRDGQENTGSVAERFRDTFTKLRAFEIHKLGFTKACFLDADMAVFQNPDSIFSIPLPGRDWIGTNHACVCNLDQDPWAPQTWVKGNCAHTTITSPDGVFGEILPDCRPTYRLLNSGMFLYYPSEALWTNMLEYFNTSTQLGSYQFPDQDFLAEFFWDKWEPMSWKYNALKTMRYWHPKMWSDEEVVVVHYIVDKPWERKVSPEGIAGHLGRDGETHQWWWDLYEDWSRAQKLPNNIVVKEMLKLVDTKKPFDEKIPLPQEPGTTADVLPYPPY